jgi:transcriptional regulator with XRE-family HTH domain
MLIGEKLRQIREEKHLSQGDIEKRTGLLRCYLSRVENGHSIPSLETIEKLAAALEMPLYQIFHTGEGPARPIKLQAKETRFKLTPSQLEDFRKFHRAFSRMNERSRLVLIAMAQRMARRTARSRKAAQT